MCKWVWRRVLWRWITDDRQHCCGRAAHSYVTVAAVSDQADHRKGLFLHSHTADSLRHLKLSLKAGSSSACHVLKPVSKYLLISTMQLPIMTKAGNGDILKTHWLQWLTQLHFKFLSTLSPSGIPRPHFSLAKNAGLLGIQLHASSPFPITFKVVPEAMCFVVEREKGWEQHQKLSIWAPLATL